MVTVRALSLQSDQHRCSSSHFLSSALSSELQQIEGYCKTHSLSVTVDVANNITSFSNLPAFVAPISSHHMHRLIPCSSVGSGPKNGMCFRTLRFSSPSPPANHLGIVGDIWVVSEPGQEVIYHRIDSMWVPWSRGDDHAHWKDCYALGCTRTALEWRAASYSFQRSWDDSRCKQCIGAKTRGNGFCGKCKTYASLTVPDIVRYLYNASGQPLIADSASHTSRFGPDGEDKPATLAPQDAPPTYETPPVSSDVDPRAESKAGPPPQNGTDQVVLDGSSRHPSFWYAGDLVVVRVEKMLYRLFRTFLVRHSEFFSDALAHPRQAGGSAETVDECPVVELTNVSTVDFEAWLKALENGLYVLLLHSGFNGRNVDG